MRRPGVTRERLARLIAAGVHGDYRALASAAGLDPCAARAALKEMRRAGQLVAVRQGPAAAPAVYMPAVQPVDALAVVRQAWR